MALSFIHCADLHLGTPFKGVAEHFSSNENEIREILHAPENAFCRIIDFAINAKVDFVLFAGDITDSVNVNWRSISVFAAGLERLEAAGIKAYVIAGNHDALPNPQLEKACASAVFFRSDEIQYHNFKDKAIIGGISFCAENAKVNTAVNFKRQAPELFHIALFHGNIGGQQGHDNYSPASINDLKNCNMDYWALGHIHEKIFLSEKNPIILYSGSTLSHHVNESSPKGFYHIKVDDFKQVTYEFKESSPLVFQRIETNLENCNDLNDTVKKVNDDISSVISTRTAEKYFIELLLCGKTAVDHELREQNIEDLRYLFKEKLPNNCYIGKIKIKTSNLIDKELFCRENIFGNDLHKSFEDERNSDYPSLQSELTALKRTYGKFINSNELDLNTVTEDAENEIIRMLTEDML